VGFVQPAQDHGFVGDRPHRLEEHGVLDESFGARSLEGFEVAQDEAGVADLAPRREDLLGVRTGRGVRLLTPRPSSSWCAWGDRTRGGGIDGSKANC
jgi:hypothetical protein